MPIQSTISAGCDAIDAMRAELPPVTNQTATAEQLLQWLTDAAQYYARSVDARNFRTADHLKGQMDGFRAELLRRLG